MTEIAFHFNLPDKTRYLCRLLRKAVVQGARVSVVGSDAQLGELDAALWSFSPVDFVPHCRFDSDAPLRDASPVILGGTAHDAPHQDVLLNLGQDVASGFERFGRVIEVVGQEDEERAPSRKRWKHYQELGYPIVRHDLAQKEFD